MAIWRQSTGFILFTLAIGHWVGLCMSQTNKEYAGPLSELDAYPYHAQLDENYNLQWKFNSTHIMFHVNVKTNGWVGLGISNHGDMYPGDMVIGWMSGEAVHFHDRHATGRVLPVIDTQQDWHLVDFKREDGLNSSFTVVRKLNTCDEDGDLPIEKGTTRVIYAYSQQVPDSDDNILYHGSSTRGSKSILLLDPPPLDGEQKKMPNDVIAIDFTISNYSVPKQDTTYACTYMKFPSFSQKHHVIRYEPMIQVGHEKLVHHFVLYYCKNPVAEHFMYTPHECYSGAPEELAEDCYFTMLAWAVGGTAFDFPAHVGYSLFTPEDPVYIRLEIHYDNVDMIDGLVDNSGLRMFLTKEIRQYDAGMMEVGAYVGWKQIIPPGIPDFMTRGYCPPACFEKSFGDGEIKIFADFLHSHLLGRRLVTRHIRNGTELPPILEDNHYDFDYQETRLLTEERAVTKDDMLMTDCFYDSTKRTTVTYGGESTRQEMCLSFLLYYPRTSLTDCFTEVTYAKDDKEMYPGGVLAYVNATDWSIQSNRDAFVKNVQTSDVVDYCVYQDTYEGLPSSQPKQFQEYEPEEVCKQDGAGKASTTSSHISIVVLTSVFSASIKSFFY